MINSMRVLGILVVVTAAVAISACGGGDSSGQTASPQNFVSATAAIDASGKSYKALVQSFQGKMSVGFGAGGEQLATSGDMKFEAPDKVYFSMNIPTAGQMEVLLNGSDVYFAVHGQWYKGDTSSLGIDLTEFRRYARDRGPVDYVSALKGLKNPIKLADEEIDGKTYWHYQAALDLNALTGELPPDMLDPELLKKAADALQGSTMDIYIDPGTVLPRRYTMQMSMDFGLGEKPFSMNMQMDFLKYNEDVGMPDVPKDAKQFDASALSGLTGGS